MNLADDTKNLPPPEGARARSESDRTSAMRSQRQIALGGFPIEEKIGEGGMGVVYRAFDPDLERRVAIKRIHPRLAADEEFSQRFISEARAVAAVTHANIAQIFSIHARDSESPAFFVMEYVDGPSVERMVKDGGPLAPARALDLALQAARGLAAAHLRGLVHRDIKPSNLLTTHRGELKLVDFGLARRLATAELQTVPGVVLGTPHYVSPEQARGWAVDHRSDIYSLGCTLFYMLTGDEPFPGETMVDVVVAHTQSPPPRAGDRRGDLTPGVDRLLGKMLAKRPEERHQSYDELIGELKSLLSELAPEREAAPPVGRTRRAAMAVLLVLSTAALVFVWAGILERPRGAPTPREYFGPAIYVAADGGKGEGVYYRFADPIISYTELFLVPDVDEPMEGARPPVVQRADERLYWENWSGPIIFPCFLEIDEVELAGLRFQGAPDFELRLGVDPDRPGDWLRIYFGVGDRNSGLVECQVHGERSSPRLEGALQSRVDFTLRENLPHTLRLEREPNPAGGVRYDLAIEEHPPFGPMQERARVSFALPHGLELRGAVQLAAAGIQPRWSVSVGTLLVRGRLDPARVEKQQWTRPLATLR